MGIEWLDDTVALLAEPRQTIRGWLVIHEPLGETSKLLTAGCNQNAAAFHCCVELFLYKLASAG